MKVAMSGLPHGPYTVKKRSPYIEYHKDENNIRKLAQLIFLMQHKVKLDYQLCSQFTENGNFLFPP